MAAKTGLTPQFARFASVAFSSALAIVPMLGQGLRQASIPRDRPGLLRAPMQWQHGFLIDFTLSRAWSDTPEVWEYDASGNMRISPTPLTFPDASRVIIHSIAARPDGAIIVSSEEWDHNGNLATTLSCITPPGNVTKAIQTGSFVAEKMAVTDSGDIWAFGEDARFQDRAGGDYLTLMHYDANGELLSATLPRASFHTKYTSAQACDSGDRALSVTPTQIGLYSCETEEWIDLNSSGDVLDRFVVPRPTETVDGKQIAYRLSYVTMVQSNVVYAWVFPALGQNATTMPRRGIYKLDRAAHRWMQVSWPFGPEHYGIWGSAGDELIAKDGCCHYSWFQPAK